MNIKKNQHSLGILAGISASICFSCMALIIQDLKVFYSSHQLSFFRGIFISVLLFPFVFKKIPNLFSKNAIFTWTRSFFGASAILIYFYNIQNGGASLAKSLQNLSPFFVMLFSYLFYKETSRPLKVVGVVFMIFGAISLKYSSGENASDLVLVLGLLCALFTCFAYMSLKAASIKFSSLLIVWQFGVVISFVSLLFVGQFKNIDYGLIKIGCVGLFGLIGQVLLTKSHKLLNNTLASSLTLLTLVFIIIGEFILFSMPFTLSLSLSFAILLFGSYLIIKFK